MIIISGRWRRFKHIITTELPNDAYFIASRDPLLLSVLLDLSSKPTSSYTLHLLKLAPPPPTHTLASANLPVHAGGGGCIRANICKLNYLLPGGKYCIYVNKCPLPPPPAVREMKLKTRVSDLPSLSPEM